MSTTSESKIETPTAPKTPPLMKGAPIIGVMPAFVQDPTALLLKAARTHPGAIVALPIGPVRIYLLSEPTHVQHVLNDNWRNYVKGAMWKPTRRLMGNGLVTNEGETWIRSRRLVQPLFTPKHLTSLIDTLAGSISRAGDRLLAQAARGAEVDMAQEMMHLVQVVFLEALFGVGIAAADTETVGRAVVRALEAINLRAFLYFLPEWFPFPGERQLTQDIAIIDQTVFRIVQERRRSGESSNDLLSLLLKARDDGTGDGMDDRQLRDELVTMFVAGNDTTAVAMTWFWYVIDEYPDVGRRLRAELDEVLGGRPPTWDDLAKLTYTKAVIQETMRLYPPGWIIPRVAESADVIGGFSIPAGATVLMSEYVTQRSERLWDRPTVFDPTRFDPTLSAQRPRYAYFPFGGGPRQCMGAQLAMMMMQMIIASIAPKMLMHRLPTHQVKPQSTITLRPRGGLKMTLRSL